MAMITYEDCSLLADVLWGELNDGLKKEPIDEERMDRVSALAFMYERMAQDE